MKSCYQVHQEPLTYDEALKECRKEINGEPGDLASLHSPHEQGEKTHFLNFRLFCDKYPTGIYLFKVSNMNTRTRCEICSKLTITTPERR